MLVIINLKGSEADFIPKIEQMSPEDQRWLTAKYEGRTKTRAIHFDRS